MTDGFDWERPAGTPLEADIARRVREAGKRVGDG